MITCWCRSISERMPRIKEAKRLLAPHAIGFSSFDAGTADMNVLNDPEKPCYGQFGGQQSFMVNFALAEAVAKQMEAGIIDHRKPA